VFFGNSGGGAWADDGCLIGITVSLVRSVEGSGYIVPADTLL
jgi:S1-C subfamily serine protease